MASCFRFGSFIVDPDRRQIENSGKPVPIGGRAFDVLCALLAERHRVVTKVELLDRVWPGLVVEENNLAVQIVALRKLFGAAAITTSAGRGYQFVLRPCLEVGRSEAESPEALDGLPQAHGSVVVPDPTRLKATIAVLSLMTAHADASSDYTIGDVVTDQLIAALSRSQLVNVTSRLSTEMFRRRRPLLPEIASRLGARYVVTGHCIDDARTICVEAQLADATSGEVLWTDHCADGRAAVLQADSDLVQRLSGGIMRSLFATEVRQVRQLAFPDVPSHALLLAAISWLYRMSASDFEKARNALQVLKERVPTHPAPLIWLSRWHQFKVAQGWSANRTLDGRLARDFAERAIELDPESSLAYTMLGGVHTNFMQDAIGAEVLHDRALAINPNESLAWLQKGNARSFQANGRGALECVEKAISLSPIDPAVHFYQSILASAALTAGDYRRAIQAAKSALRLNDAHVSSYRVLAIAEALAGDMEAARRAVGRIRALQPDLTVASFVACSPGCGFGLIERFGEALQRAGLPAGISNADEGSGS